MYSFGVKVIYLKIRTCTLYNVHIPLHPVFSDKCAKGRKEPVQTITTWKVITKREYCFFCYFPNYRVSHTNIQYSLWCYARKVVYTVEILLNICMKKLYECMPCGSYIL